ncbi:MAG: chromate reductase [Bradymonadia bacterium]
MERLGTERIPGIEVELPDLNDFEMPIYTTDRERASGIPDDAQRFFKHIGDADALLISYAEHNGFYTAAFKNIFDWASRIDAKVFQGKPQLVLSTSPGGGGGASVLKTALDSAQWYGADVVSSLAVPRFGDNFDTESGALTDPDLGEQLGRALQRLSDRLAT